MEENFDVSEAAKAQTIATLSRLYQEESTMQRDHYEKMINEQIKATLKNEQRRKQQLEELEKNFELRRQQLMQSFAETEKNWKERNEKLDHECKKVCRFIKTHTTSSCERIVRSF